MDFDRVFKGKYWGLGVKGKADGFVLVPALVVLLTLISLVSDIVLSGALYLWSGELSGLRNQDLQNISQLCIRMSFLKQKTESKHLWLLLLFNLSLLYA